ncbi:MAG TPA: protein kinase [Verrucomicrobiae bacterium]
MNPNRSHEEEILAAALALPLAQRAAYVSHVCGDDDSLRQRIEALLQAREKTENFSEGALPKDKSAAGTIRLSLPPEEKISEKIGPYKLREKVGEGGCGVVYVADQEFPVRRRVALKVIKLGMDTRSVIARFEAERQALAMMDHPNIAKVLDAGATETGRPYFVMELVRGIRITDYCDQNKLSTHERLDLFVQICQAIQHAHQKGIIHRDIKPSNILVTLHDGVPVPKVIDFGIAKATEGRLTDLTIYTELHQFIGTPAYMSPEQAEMSGLDIDTRSDIYSLGVLLYELLTGRTPFDAKELAESGLDAMRKTIREKEPLRPSTKLNTLQRDELTTTAKRRGADAPKLINLLRGDLDWIVMKCLEKDRTRRYETANGLAVDLKRHLNNEAVAARPPSAAYKFQKAFRRNKVAFTAGFAVAAALLLGIIATTLQSVRATRAKQEAVAAQSREAVQRKNAEASEQKALAAQASEIKLRQQADTARGQAEGLVSFMIQDLQPALKDYGRLSLLKQVDEKTVDYFAALPPDLQNTGTELAQADAIEALAEIFQSSGDIKSARAKGGEALALYQRLAKQHPEIPEAEAGALNLEWLAYSTDPSHSSAELDTFQQDILRRWRELVEKYPENHKARNGLGSALWNRASFAAQRFNKPQEAIRVGLELQESIRNGMARYPENKLLPSAYASCLGVLAIAYQAVGDQQKAVQASEEAETFFDKALKEDPGNLSLLADAAEAAKNLSYRVSSISLKRSRDAELVARERYRILTSLDPANADWRYSFAMTHMMECYYLEGEGQIELARQALKKFDSLIQNLTLQPWDEGKLAQNSIDLARLAALAGDKADARVQLAVGESRFQAQYDKLPDAPFDRIQARVRWLNLKSGVVSTMEDWVELEALARETLTLIGDGLNQRPNDSELLLRRAVTQSYLGEALLRRGNVPEAVSTLEQAVTGFRDAPPAITFTDNRDTYAGGANLILAEALAKTGNFDRAKSLVESVIVGYESAAAKQPENWELKTDLVDGLVQLAGMLDPAKPEEIAQRQTSLDRAAAILNSPESQGRLTVDDKEALAKIALLRGTAEAKEKMKIKQP